MENKIIQKFGQIIIGPPGSGKTTYCQTIKDFYNNFNICKNLTDEKGINLRLCCVNLIECINICDMPKYIFSVFSVLNAMINLELPQINLILKCDLLNELKKNNKFPFDLEFF